MSVVNQETLTNRNLEVIRTGTVDVTRTGSSDGGYTDVDTGVLDAPLFFAQAYKQGASPAFRQFVPSLTYNTSTGEIWGGTRALYDPTTGFLRCFVDATSLFADFGSNETWTFRYYILREKGA